MSRTRILTATLALALTATAVSAYSNHRLAAMVRFTNQLSDTRAVTLEANRKVLFPDVAPATTTGDLAVQDTVVTFDLKWSGSDTVVATTNAPMANGGHYTVTASRATGQNPILTVIRDPAGKTP